MSPSLHDLGIDQMSVEDRIRLMGEIWDSLTSLDGFEMPESHREEIDRRIAAADAEPAKGYPWEEVQARLRSDR